MNVRKHLKEKTVLQGELYLCVICKIKKPLLLMMGKHQGRHCICRECKSHLNRLNRFGLTPSDYDLLLKHQKYRCAICELELELEKKRSAVDHCHKTGEIRGILCRNCNTGIGLFKDNVKIIKNAMRYIHDPTARNLVKRTTRTEKNKIIREYTAQKTKEKASSS